MVDYILDVTPRVKEWKDLEKFLSDMAKSAPASVAIAVYETLGEKTFEISQKKVPIDTGALKSTAALEPPKKANGYTTKVSYGREPPKVPPSRGRDDVIYAQAVHELDKNYNFGKEHLYLEKAAQEAINQTSAKDIAARALEISKDKGRRNPSRLKKKTGIATRG